MSFPHRSANAVAALHFVLPFPPSVNRYYRHVGHRTLLSREGRAYRDAVCTLLAGRVRQPLSVPLQAELHLYPHDRRRRDWDNFQKAVWDALQHAGIYQDDCQIRRAVVEMHEPDGKARAECHIAAFDIFARAQRTPIAVSGSDSSRTRSPGNGGSTKSCRRLKTTCCPANSSTTDG